MNLANYNRVLDHITQHPEQHNQANWCGTAMCFAGHAQAMAGKSMDQDTVQADAKAWLGINNAVAYTLFSASCTLDTMRLMADAYRSGGDAAACLAAVQQNGYAMHHAPEELKTEAMCLTAVQQNGYALEYAPAALVTEPVCLAAVQQSGYALRHVPEELKTEAMCLAAVQQDGDALYYVPEELKTEAMCLAAGWGCAVRTYREVV